METTGPRAGRAAGSRAGLAGDTLPWGSITAITGDENLLILAARPGDESLAVGGLIAQSCRRGRPPFVMILGDGTASAAPSNALPPDRHAALHERESREAVRLLGLDDDRLLMAGLFDGTIPGDGSAFFQAVMRGVIQVMWRTDCNIVCAPWPSPPLSPYNLDPAHVATHQIAAAVAARSGVGHLSYAVGASAVPQTGWRLDITGQADAKRRAIAAHRTLLTDGGPVAPFEILLAAAP